MVAVRDFIGHTCPRCSKDILQQAPSTNRMPGQDLAWCPSCNVRLSAEDLAQKKRGGFLRRLFGGRPSA